MSNKAPGVDWLGMLAEVDEYGRHGDSKHDYKTIAYEDSKMTYKDHMHAAHGMLYARSDEVLWNLYSVKAAISMQMRCDGLLGFPGGLVDHGEDPVTGLNREFHEEIGLDLKRHSFKDEHHVVTFLQAKKELVLHFYAQEITLEQFREIEGKCTQAHEYGLESLGCFRPPLFIMGDNFRGFPAFLCNQFAGNAKEELLCGLLHTGLFTREEMEKAVELADNFKKNLKMHTTEPSNVSEESGADSVNKDEDKERWGMLLKYAPYGRHGDTKHDFKIISRHDAITKYADYEHVAHGMFYAKDERVIWNDQSFRATVLMQMRFDGRLGFPGGHINHGEDTVTGLNREMHEEIRLDINKHKFNDKEHVVTYLHEEKRFVLHFFVKKVTSEDFKHIEENCIHAHEYGIEALGCLRPPLYTNKDNFRGFPAFLSHQFAGNAREELFVGLLHARLFTQDEIDKAVRSCDEFFSLN